MNKVFIWCTGCAISQRRLYCVYIWATPIPSKFPKITTVYLHPPTLFLTFIMVIVNPVPVLAAGFCWVAKCLDGGQFVPRCPIMPDACGYTIWSLHLHTRTRISWPPPLPLPPLYGRLEAIMTSRQIKRTKIWQLTCGGEKKECGREIEGGKRTGRRAGKFTRGVCLGVAATTFHPKNGLVSTFGGGREPDELKDVGSGSNKLRLRRRSFRIVAICLFLIIYPVIITILAKITRTHIAHYLGNTAHRKLISCWGRLPNPDWPWDIPITMSQCLRESLLSYLSWNTHHWFMRRLCL